MKKAEIVSALEELPNIQEGHILPTPTGFVSTVDEGVFTAFVPTTNPLFDHSKIPDLSSTILWHLPPIPFRLYNKVQHLFILMSEGQQFEAGVCICLPYDRVMEINDGNFENVTSEDWHIFVPKQKVQSAHVDTNPLDCVDILTGESVEFPSTRFVKVGFWHSHNTMDLPTFSDSGLVVGTTMPSNDGSELQIPGIYLLTSCIRRNAFMSTVPAQGAFKFYGNEGLLVFTKLTVSLVCEGERNYIVNPENIISFAPTQEELDSLVANQADCLVSTPVFGQIDVKSFSVAPKVKTFSSFSKAKTSYTSQTSFPPLDPFIDAEILDEKDVIALPPAKDKKVGPVADPYEGWVDLDEDFAQVAYAYYKPSGLDRLRALVKELKGGSNSSAILQVVLEELQG